MNLRMHRCDRFRVELLYLFYIRQRPPMGIALLARGRILIQFDKIDLKLIGFSVVDRVTEMFKLFIVLIDDQERIEAIVDGLANELD